MCTWRLLIDVAVLSMAIGLLAPEVRGVHPVLMRMVGLRVVVMLVLLVLGVMGVAAPLRRIV